MLLLLEEEEEEEGCVEFMREKILGKRGFYLFMSKYEPYSPLEV